MRFDKYGESGSNDRREAEGKREPIVPSCARKRVASTGRGPRKTLKFASNSVTLLAYGSHRSTLRLGRWVEAPILIASTTNRTLEFVEATQVVQKVSVQNSGRRNRPGGSTAFERQYEYPASEAIVSWLQRYEQEQANPHRVELEHEE